MPQKRSTRPEPSSSSRPPGRIVGIEYDANRAHVTVIDPKGIPLHAEETPLRGAKGKAVLLKELAAAAREAIAETDDRGGRVLGVGVACPGLIDPVQGICRDYTLVRGFTDVPVRAILEQELGFPVAIDHDMIALTMAEKECGAARGIPDFICLIIRAGVGLGMVAAGQIVRGTTNNSGEVGLTAFYAPGQDRPVRFQEVTCEPRVLEQVRAALDKRKAPALADILHHEGGDPTPVQVLRAAHAGDEALRKIVHDFGYLLGYGIGNLVNILNPRTVVLHGRFFEDRDDLLFQAIEEGARVTAVPRLWEIVNLFPSPLGVYGGALGAALLALDQHRHTHQAPGDSGIGEPVA